MARKSSIHGGEGRTAALLLTPTLVVLAIVILYPLVAAVWGSLHASQSGLDENGFVTEGERFVGLANYASILTDGRFHNALMNTTLFMVGTVALETVIGIGMALAMNQALRGRGLVRASILVPWAIPTAVSGLLWRWIFQADGIVNDLTGQTVLWTADGWAARWAVVIAEVWKTAPFIGLLVLAGLQLIPDEVYEAAQIDGAGRWQRFLNITLPLVRPTVLVAVLFRVLDALRMFDLPFVLIGPRKESVETLSMLTWDESNQLRYGMASAHSVLLFCFVALVAVLFVKILGANVVGEETGAVRRGKKAKKQVVA